MPAELQTMIGYSQPGASLGYWDSGRHPLHALTRPGPLDWHQPIAEQKDAPGVVPEPGRYPLLGPGGAAESDGGAVNFGVSAGLATGEGTRESPKL